MSYSIILTAVAHESTTHFTRCFVIKYYILPAVAHESTTQFTHEGGVIDVIPVFYEIGTQLLRLYTCTLLGKVIIAERALGGCIRRPNRDDGDTL